MKRTDKPIEDIYDLLAIRIVLKSTGKKGKEDCWRVYSIITDLYKPLPGALPGFYFGTQVQRLPESAHDGSWSHRAAGGSTDSHGGNACHRRARRGGALEVQGGCE